jgi:hypothetical protein
MRAAKSVEIAFHKYCRGFLERGVWGDRNLTWQIDGGSVVVLGLTVGLGGGGGGFILIYSPVSLLADGPYRQAL